MITPAPRSFLRLIPWMLAAVLAAALAMVLLMSRNGVDPNAGTVSLEFPPPAWTTLAGVFPNMPAISPDGKIVVFYAADSSGGLSLYARPIGSFDAQKLNGTEGGYLPFWSPDSRFVGFFALGKLKKININGGPPLTLCDAEDGRGGSWNQEGTIIFTPRQIGPICQIQSAGGNFVSITHLDTARLETTHRWPCFLPDGVHFLYFARMGMDGDPEKDGIFIGSLKDTTRQLVMQHSGSVVYANGYLLYARAMTLIAQRFDPDARQAIGDPVPLAEGVTTVQNFSTTRTQSSPSGLGRPAGHRKPSSTALFPSEYESRTRTLTGERPWSSRVQ